MTIILLGSIIYSNYAMGVIEDDNVFPTSDQVAISEIQDQVEWVVNIPPSGSNTSSASQIVNISFFYQGQELYLAVEFYPPNLNDTCGGGGGDSVVLALA